MHLFIKSTRHFLAALVLMVSTSSAILAEEAGGESQAENFFDSVGNFVFLQRNLSGQGAREGALFAYERTDDEDSFSGDFTILAEQSLGTAGTHIFELQESIEADLTTAENGQDALNFRASFLHDYALSGDPARPFDSPATHLRIGPVYESSNDFEIQNLMGEAEATVTWKRFAMGVYQDLGNWFQLRWRPLLLVQGGSNLEGTASQVEEEDTIFRVVPRIGATLNLRKLAEDLGLSSIELTAENAFAYLPLEDDQTHNFAEVSLNFNITENVGLALEYTKGEAAPRFEDADTFMVGFSIRIPPT